jgi:hypothetical protein
MLDFPEGMPADKTAGASQASHDRPYRPSSSRRSLLGFLLGAGGATIGALLSVPLFRFVLHPVFKAALPLM